MKMMSRKKNDKKICHINKDSEMLNKYHCTAKPSNSGHPD